MSRKQALPRICITATGRTPSELMECAHRALRESRFVELRLDWVTNPADAIAAIPKLLKDAARAAPARHAILQATCRRKPDGGRFTGSVARQFELLKKAARAGCRLLDLEIESAERAGADAVAALRDDAPLILSFHDFRATPPLAPVARRLRRYPADYYKIVPTATRQSDNCAELEFLSAASKVRNEEGKWVAFAMGEAGVPSRVLALSRGSAFVYAAPTSRPLFAKDSETMLAAPGQLDWKAVHNQYGVERLTGRTALYGLLGNPVRHSVGAAIHNAAFRGCGLDAVYLPLLATDLADFRRAAVRYPLAGFSVTIPHKQAILQFVDKTDGWVKAAGAANTVRIRQGRWEAINTDIEGILTPLRQAYGFSSDDSLPRNFRAVIVGNGGSARAACIALRALGCRSILVAGRNRAHAMRFAMELDGEAMSLRALERERFDLLVHATPVGMWPHSEECLLTAAQLQADTVFDLVYNPPETRLLRMARGHGCRTISGLEMFISQAARQFEFWTGVTAPLNRMRAVAKEALEGLRNSPGERDGGIG
ncbi:MAG: shikimate dehydrogenase [Acidobacteria bacterium]|nr:shikimate dehydrogenase [Acidobacteriota bacterium]